MNEVCMVPWRLLDSRSEQLPRGVSSRAGAFIWEIPVARCGGVEPGSCRRLPAELSCHSWMWGRNPVPSHTPGAESFANGWEGNKDLPIVSDAWLLPLPAAERAGSSKNTKTGNCWELGLMKGLMEPATRQVWKWHGVKGCSRQCRVLWAALHPHIFVSLSEWCSGVASGLSSTSVHLGGGIEITE